MFDFYQNGLRFLILVANRMRLTKEEGRHEPADHGRPFNKRKKAMRYASEGYWKKKTLMTV